MEAPGQPLDIRERVVFTTGACGLFVAALHRVCQGMPCLLQSDDPRVLTRRARPPGAPEPLHALLRLPDGTVLDAEGRRPLQSLLRSWGIRRGEAWSLVEDPGLLRTAVSFGRCDERLVQALAAHLHALGWAGTPPGFEAAKPRLTSAQIDRIKHPDAAEWWQAWVAGVMAGQSVSLPTASLAAAKSKRKPPR